MEAGEPVDGALAAYAASGNIPFSRVAPAGTDWHTLGVRTPIPA